MASYREKVPQRFLCPITLMPMHRASASGGDPCGHSYERSAILAWLKKSPTSPMTRTFLAPAMLKTNFALHAQIEAQKVRRTRSGAKVLLCCVVLLIGLSLCQCAGPCFLLACCEPGVLVQFVVDMCVLVVLEPMSTARANAVRANAVRRRPGRVVRLCSVRLDRAAFVTSPTSRGCTGP